MWKQLNILSVHLNRSAEANSTVVKSMQNMRKLMFKKKINKNISSDTTQQ